VEKKKDFDQCNEFYGMGVWDSIPCKGMDFYSSSYLSHGLSTGDNTAGT